MVLGHCELQITLLYFAIKFITANMVKWELAWNEVT